MPRTSIKTAASRTEARGLDALAEDPAARHQAVAPTSSPARAETWTASHRRVTFFCANDIWDAIQAERSRAGRSKSEIIESAIRKALGK